MFKMLSITSISHCVIPEIAKNTAASQLNVEEYNYKKVHYFMMQLKLYLFVHFHLSLRRLFFKLFAISVKFGIKTSVLSSNTKVFVVLRLL